MFREMGRTDCVALGLGDMGSVLHLAVEFRLRERAEGH